MRLQIKSLSFSFVVMTLCKAQLPSYCHDFVNREVKKGEPMLAASIPSIVQILKFSGRLVDGIKPTMVYPTSIGPWATSTRLYRHNLMHLLTIGCSAVKVWS